jgi:non-homologous end joining protein Ku
VLKLIRDKAKGKEVVMPEPEETTKVGDLMEALRQSIEATKKGRRPAETAAEGNGRRAKAKRTTRRSTKRRTLKKAS